MPLAVGGGDRTLDDLQELPKPGAGKLSINTQGVMGPEFLREASPRSRSGCIVASMVYKTTDYWTTDLGASGDGAREAFTRSGAIPTGLDSLNWAKKQVQHGAGEVMLTSMDRKGTGNCPGNTQ